ncbi:MAG: alpha/beta hydrolase [Candidatus Lernaella stagnicola]|nr:alpha/beta hydrolase [Candidatus Lernaella stagnicola]
MQLRLILAAALVGVWMIACGPPALAPILNPDNITPQHDVRYFQGKAKDAWRHSADVYLPVKGENWPVAVVIHGGGWVTNDKSVVDNIGYAFAQAGIATVCPNYRLFPANRYPAQVNDVVQAVAWTKREMGKRGADVDDFTLIGYSAGALPVALAALDKKHLAKVGLDPNRDLTRVVVMSGVYDVADLPLGGRQVFTNRTAVWRDASPIRHVRAGAPPMLIMRAERDWNVGVSMKEQSIKFYRAMRSVGADVRIVEIPDCDHDHVEAQVGRDPLSQTYRELMAFMGRDAALSD